MTDVLGRQEAQALLALTRQEADSGAAASQLEIAARISRIRQEAEALVAAARDEAAASQVCSMPWIALPS